MLGGVCCTPSALRSRNSTVDILMKLVIVTTARVRKPSDVAAIRIPTMPGRLSPKVKHPYNAHTDATIHVHQRALADEPAVGADPPQRVGGAVELQHRSHVEPTQLAEAEVEPPHVEGQLHRQLVRVPDGLIILHTVHPITLHGHFPAHPT